METDRPTDGRTNGPTDRRTRQNESIIAPSPTICGGGIITNAKTVNTYVQRFITNNCDKHPSQ